MSGIVLTAATRQNLLSAQGTADLLGTTQNRLATGKKVNSALDNPLNFFTAQSLDSRAGDLSGLLDGISNGIQTIQAANTGITNIQKLVDSAKSVANQAKATAITTTGTSTADYASSASAATISFTIDGVAKSFSLASGSSLDTAIAGLNTAAGSSVFSKDSTGKRIAVNGVGKIEITGANATAIGFASVATDKATTTYYNEANNSADLTVNGLEARSNFATQFNDLLSQIDQLSNDASFNGTNLINSSDNTKQLKIAFNADNTSNVTLKNVDATSAGLSLTAITLDATNSFTKNADIDTSITSLGNATSKLRSYATSFGSNLTIVQNRQDFTKNLINTLQTGSSNLVNADLNEEAANSQALSTRQSLAISALSLANQSQQNVLQLLR